MQRGPPKPCHQGRSRAATGSLQAGQGQQGLSGSLSGCLDLKDGSSCQETDVAGPAHEGRVSGDLSGRRRTDGFVELCGCSGPAAQRRGASRRNGRCRHSGALDGPLVHRVHADNMRADAGWKAHNGHRSDNAVECLMARGQAICAHSFLLIPVMNKPRLLYSIDKWQSWQFELDFLKWETLLLGLGRQ